jgi:2-dehydropantoate 2-reductase
MILIYGAGVIGQIYAARLHEVGHDVTVLARHRTLETLARARYEARDITVAEHWPEDVVAAPLRVDDRDLPSIAHGLDSVLVQILLVHLAQGAAAGQAAEPGVLRFAVERHHDPGAQSDKRRACRHDLSGVLS